MRLVGGEVSSQVKGLELSLRLLVIPLSVASIWIAVTNKEDNTDYGNLEFNNFVGLKYMVFISAVSAGYALFAAISSFFTCLSTKPWFFFLTDQVVAYLMVTSMAALVEFVYLAYNGDRLVSWSEACASYGNFCTRLKIALSLHIIALFCFLFLALITAYTLFSTFDPPFLPSKDDHPQHQTT